jgi:oxygen-dependent protoporphyrinogen oxidase
VNNVVSAVLHGIYAGDVWQLKVSLQPLLWFWEARHGSITKAMWEDVFSKTTMLEQDARLMEELIAKPLVTD